MIAILTILMLPRQLITQDTDSRSSAIISEVPRNDGVQPFYTKTGELLKESWMLVKMRL